MKAAEAENWGQRPDALATKVKASEQAAKNAGCRAETLDAANERRQRSGVARDWR
jgi:hypothetical protein